MKSLKLLLFTLQKHFYQKKMCRIIEKENIEMDAVSGGELYTIKASGFPMKKFICTEIIKAIKS